LAVPHDAVVGPLAEVVVVVAAVAAVIMVEGTSNARSIFVMVE